MVLRKPSEYFKKKEEVISIAEKVQEMVEAPELNTFSDAFESFKKNLSKIEVLSDFSETLDNYRVNIERVNYLSEKVNDIQSEIQTLLKKEDLDFAMMSQLIVVEQSISDLQNKVKGINEKSLAEIRLDVVDLTESVNDFFEVEVPKYKKIIFDSEFRTNVRCEELEQNINKTLEDTETKFENFDEKLKETVNDVLDVVNSVETFNTQKIEEVQNLQKTVNNELKTVEQYKEELIKKVTDLEVGIFRNESHIKTQNEYIENIQEEIIRDVISKLPINELEEQSYELTKKLNYIQEVFDNFNSEKLTEGLLNEPPSVKNQDPLTPLDKNFVTLDQLQQHYKLFVNRIQQQLSTLGGGGETRLKYLDDVVGIATNASAYDNKFLKYNHSIGKFEFVSVGAGSQNLDDTLQLGNTSSLGMSVGVTTVTSLNVDSTVYFDTNTVTFSSSSPTEIYSFSSLQYRSARIQIQITQGTDYQTSDVLIIHNGSSANIIEYASISTNDYLGTFDAVISSGNVSLQVLMASSSSATIKVASQVIKL